MPNTGLRWFLLVNSCVRHPNCWHFCRLGRRLARTYSNVLGGAERWKGPPRGSCCLNIVRGVRGPSRECLKVLDTHVCPSNLSIVLKDELPRPERVLQEYPIWYSREYKQPFQILTNASMCAKLYPISKTKKHHNNAVWYWYWYGTIATLNLHDGSKDDHSR